jgi:hypothetical protein
MVAQRHSPEAIADVWKRVIEETAAP